MRLFEDIIDSVEPEQDVRSASSVVSDDSNDDVYIIMKHVDNKQLDQEGFSSYARKIKLVTAYENANFEKQVAVLYSILESSTIIDEFSTFYIWVSPQQNLYQFNIFFNFVPSPDYTAVLEFITRINNFFWNTVYNFNMLEIVDSNRDCKLTVHMNFQQGSWWKHMYDTKYDINRYLKSDDGSVENILSGNYNLERITKYSDFIKDIACMIYGTFFKSRDGGLLIAISEFDTKRINIRA